MTPPTPPDPWTAGRIAEFLSRAFVHPDQVCELRALNVGRPHRTIAGWFDGRHLADLGKTALAIARQATGVYFTPNPVDPALLSRCPNRTDEVSRDRFKTTTDADILERRYLFVDLDPDRSDGNNGQPSSAEELTCAVDAAAGVAEELLDHGWRRPLRMLSGNGVHLLFPLAVPLPAKVPEYEADPLRDYLDLCRDWHFRGVVRVDPNTYNAVRMLKVPGTRAVKGDATAGRPHRTADVLEVPDDWPAPRQPPDRKPVAEPVEPVAPAIAVGDQSGTPAGAGGGRPAAPPEGRRPAAPAARVPPARRPRGRGGQGRSLFG